jgi:signal transduction histidine kinase
VAFSVAELRRPSLRIATGVMALTLGVVEVEGVLQSLRSHARLRERVVRSIRDAGLAAYPRLADVLSTGGTEAWEAATRAALGAGVAVEVEVYDREGRLLLARPRPAPVTHWPVAADLGRLPAERVLTWGPLASSPMRIVSYLAFQSGDRPVIVRLSAEVPEVVADLREHRRLMIVHGAGLVVALIGAALALFPGKGGSPPSPGSALKAYEEAMDRLGDQGRRLASFYEQERNSMRQHMEDREAMARAGELTAGIVHEMRNALGTILGYARLIEKGPSGSEVQSARHIREECETVEVVIRRFMDFVREETLNRMPFDLGRMLTRVVARESQSRAGGDVSLDVAEAGTLVGDEELLERAFENLVRNAREAAGEGGHVWVSVADEAQTATVTVADDGPGMSPDARARLRPLFSTKPGGLGLGLGIAFKMVRLHGGELALEDRLPRGLLVAVRIPRKGSAP